MAGPSDYHRGEMDIAEQTATFHLVMGMTKWGSLVIAVGVLFFTLLFCVPGAGFFGAAAASAVLLVAGIVFLREKPAAAH